MITRKISDLPKAKEISVDENTEFITEDISKRCFQKTTLSDILKQTSTQMPELYMKYVTDEMMINHT